MFGTHLPQPKTSQNLVNLQQNSANINISSAARRGILEIYNKEAGRGRV